MTVPDAPNVAVEPNGGLTHLAHHEGFADLRTTCGRLLVEPRIFDIGERPVTCSQCTSSNGSEASA